MISQMTDRIDKPKVILLLELAASLECELWSQQKIDDLLPVVKVPTVQGKKHII